MLIYYFENAFDHGFWGALNGWKGWVQEWAEG
jgi:hypothetical protein